MLEIQIQSVPLSLLTPRLIVRVATFAIRADVATLSIQSSDYETLLIVAAVFVIAGFLFLIEAVFDLLVQWWVGLRDSGFSSS
jgi:hypothetical protein